MLKIGMHLKSSRTIYSHHGIYIGDGKVIHYSGLAEGLSFGRIEVTTLNEFSGTTGYEIIKHDNIKYSSHEIVKRAKSRLQEDAYHLLTNNCEHFANWCIEGNHNSKQAFVAKPFNKSKKSKIESSLEKKDKLEAFREQKLKIFF